MPYYNEGHMIVPYYNEDHSAYAILVSHGFGSGWATENGDLRLAYDSRIIDWYISLTGETLQLIRLHGTSANKAAENFIHSLGYNTDFLYFGGFKFDMIEWVPVGKAWRLHEYDGAESIEYLNEDDWVCFNG